MTARPSLRQRLADGEQLTGALVRLPAEDLVEMLAVAGFDLVLIDCEHGPADVVDLRHHIAVADGYSVATLVRVGDHEPMLVGRALDAGAEGIVVPHVDDPATAEAAVRSAHYPPRGSRGFATYTRAGRFGTADPQEHQARLNAQTLVIGMVESPVGVRSAAATLAVDRLDGYLVGPADLAASSAPEDPPLEVQVAAVHAAGRDHGSLRADIVSTVEAAAQARDAGAHLVVYNLTAVLMATFERLVSGRRGTGSG